MLLMLVLWLSCSFQIMMLNWWTGWYLEGISFTGKSSHRQSGELSGRLMTTTVTHFISCSIDTSFGTEKMALEHIHNTLHSYIPNMIDALQSTNPLLSPNDLWATSTIKQWWYLNIQWGRECTLIILGSTKVLPWQRVRDACSTIEFFWV